VNKFETNQTFFCFADANSFLFKTGLSLFRMSPEIIDAVHPLAAWRLYLSNLNNAVGAADPQSCGVAGQNLAAGSLWSARLRL
jgi:hypothetical protein